VDVAGSALDDAALNDAAIDDESRSAPAAPAALEETLRWTVRSLELAQEDVRVRVERSDAALLETLAQVRAAQDEVGNSIAVVLGWLRMMPAPAADGTRGGIQIAIRRLEETQATVATLLRRTAETALAEHASDPVNITAILRGLGHAVGDASDAWVLANRTHLATFLTMSADIVDHEPACTPETWSLPLRGPGLLTTTLLTALTASGGSLATHATAQSVQWRRTASPPAP
jgi:hypothetical protein